MISRKPAQGIGASIAIAVVTAGSLVTADELTVEKNMKKQVELHQIEGESLKATGPNYQFCEVAPFIGTTKENAVANFYNPTGVDNCTEEDFEKIVAAKDQIIKDTGARDVFLNPSRYWTWDEFEIFSVGDKQVFGGVTFAWMAAIPAMAMEASVGENHYNPGEIYRNNTYTYKAGTEVYLLDMGDGKVLVMQSWTKYVLADLTADTLSDLGDRFKELPEGWSFRTKVLEKDLTISPPPPDRLAWVTMDEFMNTYQGCGFANDSCNYIP